MKIIATLALTVGLLGHGVQGASSGGPQKGTLTVQEAKSWMGRRLVNDDREADRYGMDSPTQFVSIEAVNGLYDNVRVIEFGSMYSQEFDERRVNVRVDERHKIAQVWIG